MGRLSNFGRSVRPSPPHDNPAQPATSPRTHGPSIITRPATPGELPLALRLALGSNGTPADEQHVEHFVEFAAGRGIDTAQVWLAVRSAEPSARDGAVIHAALLPIVSPGRTMLLLGGSAQVKPAAVPDPIGPAGQLIEAVCAHFAARSLQLAQVLLDPSDEPARRLYERHDFRRIAHLLYLQTSPRRRYPLPPLPDYFTWLPYSPQSHGLFVRTIARTYEGSLDCPSLNGLRDMEDVVAGHKASGDFEPGLWTLLLERGEPLGVLLLSPTRASDTMELVYLGLAPTARGRGVADLMVRHALATTAAAGVSRLSLAVDADNVPALRLYYRHGLKRVAAKLAMMRLLHGEWRNG